MKREDSKFESAGVPGVNGKTEVLRLPRRDTRSVCELEYRLLLAYDLGLLDYRKYKQIESLIHEENRMPIKAGSADLRP